MEDRYSVVPHFWHSAKDRSDPDYQPLAFFGVFDGALVDVHICIEYGALSGSSSLYVTHAHTHARRSWWRTLQQLRCQAPL